MYVFFLLVSAAFANTFDLKGSVNDFSLTIDARKLTFISPGRKLDLELKECSLPLARALNAELLAIRKSTGKIDDLVFRADGNTFFVAKNSVDGKKLSGMERRIAQFARDEKTACK